MLKAAVILLLAATASAGTVNDPTCRPPGAHPHPVVLVHGRSGHFTDMHSISDALLGAGFCVFGQDYGLYDGQTGLDHLTVSGGQLRDFVQQVLATTGATKVDAVGYSEGTGVIQDFILAKGGAATVDRVVSFDGLQHPYAHAGAAGLADSDLFLPNLLVSARLVDPTITAQQVITNAIDLYAGAGGQIGDLDRGVAESPFAADLFDPVYWTALQGSLSEPNGVYLRLATSGHSLPTHDRGAGVCYTNFVSLGDTLVGPSAGFEDPASGVENIVLQSSADHGTVIDDAGGIAKMVAALSADCDASATGGDGSGDGDPGTGGDDGDGGGSGGGDAGGGHHTAGCNTGGASSPALAFVVALGLARRRRR
jgi:lipase (class 2)